MLSNFSDNTRLNFSSTQRDFNFINKGFSSPSKSKLQNIFGQAKPSRQYQRLLRVKTANSGTDPAGAFKEFMGHDFIRPIERPGSKIDINSAKDYLSTRSEKWALKTSKQCSSPEKLPRFEPFKTHYFPKVKENLPNENILGKEESNCIIPNLKRNINNISNSPKFIERKSKLCISTTTLANAWVPQGNQKTMNNMSSVEYNILSPMEKNNLSGLVAMKCLDKKIAAKKKGVGEFSDLTRQFNPNYFPQYNEALNENKHIFKKYNGIFTYLYDSAYRNGEIVVPFRNEKEKAVVQKEEEKRRAYLASIKAKYESKNKPKQVPIKIENIPSNTTTQMDANSNTNVNSNQSVINNNQQMNNPSQKATNDKASNIKK